MDYQKFEHALRLIGQKATDRSTRKDAREQEETPGLQAGDVSPQAPDHMEALTGKKSGDADLEGGDAALERALRGDLRDLSSLYQIAERLRAAGHNPLAMADHLWASPNFSDGSERRALSEITQSGEWQSVCKAVMTGDWSAAWQVLEVQHSRRKSSRRLAANVAFLHERMGEPGLAQCVMAATLLARNDPHAAALAFLAAPEADAQSPEYLALMLLALRKTGDEDQVLRIAEAAATRGVCSPAARIEWAETLLDLHRYDEAYAVLGDATCPRSDKRLQLQAALILPAVTASQQDMERAHRRVHRNIHALSGTPLPEDAAALLALEEALIPTFYLGYLCRPCTGEIRAYGRFVSDVVRACFSPPPHPVISRRRAPRDRIKIGYATSCTSLHSVSRHFNGWLQHADRRAFELHLFPLEHERDWMTGYMAGLVDHCHPQTTDRTTAARQIQQADLDLLIYPEIGMDALTMRLAAQRLAPVQCTTWGHPLTSGLPTIDYFISNDRMEPPDAAEHYTERLVTLPRYGLCMALPVLPSVRKSREDFGLSPDAVVYLSAQSLFKYLPIYDDLFARIAMEVEKAVFVFAEGEYPAWTGTFLTRVQQAFIARGLNPAQYIRILPRQTFDDFLCLNCLSDVFLDPIDWSGGTTAFDALSCDLPMVILPGMLMRGRNSYGMLMQLGIEETIATDVADYVRIAVKLGLDHEWRMALSRRIHERKQLLFDDTDCVKSLEAFFRWSLGVAQPGDDALFKVWPEPEGSRL